MESPKCSKLVHMIAAFFYCRKMFSFEQSDIKSCVLRYSTVVFLFYLKIQISNPWKVLQD